MKMVISMLIGFVGGYLLIEAFYGDVNSALIENIYFWLSVLMMIVALGLIVFVYFKSSEIKQYVKGKKNDMSEDEWDQYKYNAFNALTVTASSAVILSIIAMAVQIMHMKVMWLTIASLILFVLSIVIQFFIPSLSKTFFPDRNLPEPGDKDYADKLFDASDDGEIYVMAKGLYRTTTLTTMLLIFAMSAMILYMFITQESQIFSIILVGMILVIHHVKYAMEIKDR